jgi:hypothetical protein
MFHYTPATSASAIRRRRRACPALDGLFSIEHYAVERVHELVADVASFMTRASARGFTSTSSRSFPDPMISTQRLEILDGALIRT